MQCCDNPEQALSIVESLPNINRLSLAYLIRFLQVRISAFSLRIVCMYMLFVRDTYVTENGVYVYAVCEGYVRD